MGLVVATFFYTHTMMCGIYLFFLVRKGVLSALPNQLATEGATGDLFDPYSGREERFVQMTAYLVLGMYLLFTEAYLYQVYRIFALG